MGNGLMSWRLQKFSGYTHKRVSSRESYAEESRAFLEPGRKSKDSEGKISSQPVLMYT